MLLAVAFNALRAAQGDDAPGALLGVVLPIIVGLGVVIVPVILIISIVNKRYRRALVQLQSQYPYVYFARDFKHGPCLLAADAQTVSIWRARLKGLRQEVSWQRGAVAIRQETVPISRAVMAPGIVFTDPHDKVWRLVVSDRVTARLKPLDYSAFMPFIQ